MDIFIKVLIGVLALITICFVELYTKFLSKKELYKANVYFKISVISFILFCVLVFIEIIK